MALELTESEKEVILNNVMNYFLAANCIAVAEFLPSGSSTPTAILVTHHTGATHTILYRDFLDNRTLELENARRVLTIHDNLATPKSFKLHVLAISRVRTGEATMSAPSQQLLEFDTLVEAELAEANLRKIPDTVELTITRLWQPL